MVRIFVLLLLLLWVPRAYAQPVTEQGSNVNQFTNFTMSSMSLLLTVPLVTPARHIIMRSAPDNQDGFYFSLDSSVPFNQFYIDPGGILSLDGLPLVTEIRLFGVGGGMGKFSVLAW